MNQNILVTGGLGFIASHYARLLVNSGYDVTIVDKETYAADINRIKDISGKVKLYIGDICDRELVEKIIKEDNIDTIVNAAASTHVDRAIENSKDFIYSNYVGVWNLLEIVRKNKEYGNDIRMVQISSDEVYGSVPEPMQIGCQTIPKYSFKETDRLWPGNPYSSSKAAADLLCLSYVNTYGLDICITRSSNNYGPFQDKEKFIPRMIDLGLKGKDLEVYGNGQNVRDWLWVEDNCLGVKSVMEKGKKGEIYNIGANDEKTNNQVAEIIAKRFNVGIRYISDRPGHDYRYSIYSSKIMKELGWESKIWFDVGLEVTIKHYIDEYNLGRCPPPSGGSSSRIL